MAENKAQKTPIEIMADALAEMTARAIEAERQRDEALKSSDDWYRNWQNKAAQLKEAEAKIEQIEEQLAFEIDENRKCKTKIAQLIKKYEMPEEVEEGEPDK